MGRSNSFVVVRRGISKQEDGPMLVHGLKGFHGSRIWKRRVAGERPDPELLSVRYEQFLAG